MEKLKLEPGVTTKRTRRGVAVQYIVLPGACQARHPSRSRFRAHTPLSSPLGMSCRRKRAGMPRAAVDGNLRRRQTPRDPPGASIEARVVEARPAGVGAPPAVADHDDAPSCSCGPNPRAAISRGAARRGHVAPGETRRFAGRCRPLVHGVHRSLSPPQGLTRSKRTQHQHESCRQGCRRRQSP